jgi:IS30 family transposase
MSGYGCPARVGAQGTKSRFVIATKLSGKTAAETARTIMDVVRRLAPDIRKSITFDNGGEFAGHSLIHDAFYLSTRIRQ